MSKNNIYNVKDISFEGHLLINSRTINRSGEIFDRIENKNSRGGKLELSELAELLVLLESISASASLYYDGTIPTKDKETVRAVEDRLETRADCGNLFDITEPTNEKLLKLCIEGIDQAKPILIDRIDRFVSSDGTDHVALAGIKPLCSTTDPKKIQRFVELLQAADPSTGERVERCAEIMREDFNGAKCVAGIIFQKDDPYSTDLTSDFRLKCREIVTQYGHDNKKMRLIIPMFMNSFRANFLNSLASDVNDAAFFSGPDTEYVLHQQIPLLVSYFTKTMSKEVWNAISQDMHIKDRMSSRVNFPFLGLLTFLEASPNEPYSVFKVAVDDRDPIRANFLAKKGGQKRYIHDMDANELEAFTAEKLDRIYTKMIRKYKFHDDILRVNARYVQPLIRNYPFIRGGVACAKYLASSLGIDLPEILDTRLPEAPENTGESVEYALNQTFAHGGHLTNACFTQQIDKRLQKIVENPNAGRLLHDQVQRVFGLELVFSDC